MPQYRLLVLRSVLLVCAVGLALAASSVRAVGRILYVDPEGLDAGACDTSWAAACTLPRALSVAVAGDELWLKSGTYKPGTARTDTFALRDGVAIYGGFAGSEDARDDRDWATHVTILSGDIGATGVITDNVYHVVTGSGTSSTAVLDGVTVTLGNAGGAGALGYGGGIYSDGGSPTLTNVTCSYNSAAAFGGGMYGAGGSPTLTNVTIDHNTSAEYGGGVYADTANLTLTNVTLSNNSANTGGGIFSHYATLTLASVILSNNSADLGGGMGCYYGSATLTNVVLSGNSGGFGGGMGSYYGSATLANVTFSGNSGVFGGGMLNYNISPTLANVTFSGNSVSRATVFTAEYDGNGGGVYNANSHPVMTNVTWSGNTASDNGGGMYNYASIPTVRNSIFWANTAPAGHEILNNSSAPIVGDSVVQDGCPTGSVCTNIITNDPRLGALGDWGGFSGTIPLLPGSSAIDAGDDAICASTFADQRGIARPQGAHCDAGAFESRRFALAKSGGDNQTAMIGTPFAVPLSVVVTSAFGEPVNGGGITYSAPTSGAGAIPLTSIVTISSGAAAQAVTANTRYGVYSVTANAAGVTTPALFALTNNALFLYLPFVAK